MVAPVRVRVTMLPINFGDCFLVTFVYAAPLPDGRTTRQMLFDFGCKPHRDDVARAAADRIAAACPDGLDVIVVTHRHQDHISAFGMPAVARMITRLKPKRVLRPWTEDPEAVSDGQGVAGSALGEASRRFARRLRDMQRYAATLAAAIGREEHGAAGALREAALSAATNAEAIANLDAWSAGGKGAYLSHGAAHGLESILPGVMVRVLGPPTIEQHSEVKRKESEREGEYWLWSSPLLSAAGAAEQAPFATTAPPSVRAGWSPPPEVPLGPARWLVRQMETQQRGSLERIVTEMDGVLNNTSVILLLTVGTTRLLFPGDAEIPNWEYALFDAPDRVEVLEELRKVDLYKVGHHGSRNATPRALVDLWREGAEAQRPRAALLSTRVGVYPPGHTPLTKPATAVPRTALVNGLIGHAPITLYSTGELEERFGYEQRYEHVPDGVTLEASAAGGGFRRV